MSWSYIDLSHQVTDSIKPGDLDVSVGRGDKAA